MQAPLYKYSIAKGKGRIGMYVYMGQESPHCWRPFLVGCGGFFSFSWRISYSVGQWKREERYPTHILFPPTAIEEEEGKI